MEWQLYLLFFLIAALYASVGFGGGSSYIAVLALFGVSFLLLRTSSLLCNIVVVTSGTLIFYKNGHLDWKKALPLVLSSVPLAFLGGYLPIKEQTFFLLLGATLLLAAILTWWQPQLKLSKIPSKIRTDSPFFNIGIGGAIGFLSGMVGIGGGIFLAPVLYLTRWAEAKTIAATASLFILVNSLAGLFGQMVKSGFQIDWKFALPLMAAVFLGGQVGSRIGAGKLPALWVRRATAVLIFYISIDLLVKYT